jgi:hypothetical protein
VSSKLDIAHTNMQSNRGEVCRKSSTSHRRRPLRVLFVHLDADVMEACSQELDKAQFTVKSDFVLSLAQSADQLRGQPADVMIVEYPKSHLQRIAGVTTHPSVCAGTPDHFFDDRIGNRIDGSAIG